MNENALFRLALGLASPWEVKSLEFSVEKKRLDITLEGKGAETLVAFKADLEEHGGCAETVKKSPFFRTGEEREGFYQKGRSNSSMPAHNSG